MALGFIKGIGKQLSAAASTPASTIDGFIAKIGGWGAARPTLYNIICTTPFNSLGAAFTTASLAEAVTFPGRSLSTIQRRHHGPQRDVPYERLFSGDMEITFLWPRDNGVVRTAYEQWMDKAIPSTNIVKNRSEYTGTMKIEIETGGLTITVNEVFPKLINPVTLGWNMNDEYLKQVITFSFFDYTID